MLFFLYLTVANKAFVDDSLAAIEAETLATCEPNCCWLLTMRAERTHGEFLKNRDHHGFAGGRGGKKTILQ